MTEPTEGIASNRPVDEMYHAALLMGAQRGDGPFWSVLSQWLNLEAKRSDGGPGGIDEVSNLPLAVARAYLAAARRPDDPMFAYAAGLAAGQRIVQLEHLARDVLESFAHTEGRVHGSWIGTEQIETWWQIQRGEIPPDA